MDIVYCEINHKNGLIFYLTYMGVKNNKMLFLTSKLGLLFL